MALPASAEEKMAQFQQMMNLIIGRALEVNNEKLSQDISCLVKERLAGEMELLLKDSDQKEEERFRLLDVYKRQELKSNKNQQHGIYRHNIDTSKEYFNEHMDPVVFDNATVNLEANTSDGYKDESYSADGNILEVVNGSVLSISNNGYNGYNYGKPSEIGKDTAPGRKYRFADSRCV